MKGGVLMWVLIGAGIILLYAAYKGKSPKDIVTSVASNVSQN